MKGATWELLRTKEAKDLAIHSSGTIAKTTFGNSRSSLRSNTIIHKTLRVEDWVQTRQTIWLRVPMKRPRTSRVTSSNKVTIALLQLGIMILHAPLKIVRQKIALPKCKKSQRTRFLYLLGKSSKKTSKCLVGKLTSNWTVYVMLARRAGA